MKEKGYEPTDVFIFLFGMINLRNSCRQGVLNPKFDHGDLELNSACKIYEKCYTADSQFI